MSMVQVVTDNFTRANVSPLGGNWGSCPTAGGGGGQQIVSNVCEAVATATQCVSYWSASILAPSGIFPADQYSEVTVGALTGTVSDDVYLEAMVRFSNGGDSGVTAYRFKLAWKLPMKFIT